MKGKDQKGPGRPRKEGGYRSDNERGSADTPRRDDSERKGERGFSASHPRENPRDREDRRFSDRPFQHRDDRNTGDRRSSGGFSGPREDRNSHARGERGSGPSRFSADRNSGSRNERGSGPSRFSADRNTGGRNERGSGPSRFSADRNTEGRGERGSGPSRFSADRNSGNRDERGFGPSRFKEDRNTEGRNERGFGPSRFSADRNTEGRNERGSGPSRFSADRNSGGRNERGSGPSRFREDRNPEGRPSRFRADQDGKPARFESKFGTERPPRAGSDYSPDFRKGRNAEDKKFERGFSADRAPRPSEEQRGNFKTFRRKKDEPFEYGKGAKPQYRPDYSEENLVKNLPEKQRKKIASDEKKNSDQIRLNRYIANSGLCSRREADDLIESGQITVNGKTITEMGYQVKVTDVVKYGRKILNPEKLVYVLLNKPKDFITTTEDPEGRRTVMDLVAKAGSERIYPVGRLDRATTGLLLFTNDGELAEKLSHPSHEIRKIYQVEIDKPLSKEHFEELEQGVELEDGFIKPDEVSIVTPDQQVIGIQIHSGKNRVVRRIFEQLGYEVTQLDRTTYAGLTKKDLPRGNWRFLTEKEVIRLKYMI